MKKLRRALVEPLEPRLLLSADLPGVLAAPSLLPAAGAVFEHMAESVDTGPGAPALHESRHEIVFVDAGVEDYQTLLADLTRTSGDGLAIDVVVLERDRNGVEQIGDALRSRAQDGERFDAVHVFSHGTDTGIQLGDTWLTGESLAARAGLVAEWASALTSDADLLLYGCNLASSAEGQGLVSSLALLTGADVAASVDATGAAILGGDWDLEYATGSIGNPVAVSATAQAHWAGVLDGTAIASVKNSPIPIAGDFDGTSFGAPGPTANVGGPWDVIAGAEAPTRDEKIVVGVDGSGNLSGQIWNGSSWTAFAFNDVATGLDHERWGFDVAYESASGEAVFVYANGSSGAQPLSYRTWNGTSWSGPTPITTPLAGEAKHVKLAANPLSNEMVLVATLSDKSDFALVWNGSSWGNSQILPIGSASKDVTDASVAYEQQSGHAMVVYGTATTAASTFLWNGASWTPGSLVVPVGISGEMRWSSLASDPNSDRLALGVGTDNRYVWLSIWNGTSWALPVLATSDAPHDDRLGVGVAFESQSGDAIATYGVRDDNLHYRTWSAAGGWSADRQGPDLGNHADGMTLDADPQSDTVVASVMLQHKSVAFLAWDGDSWATPGLTVADAGTAKGQPFLFLWDQEVANRAPVLTPAAPALPAIAEDDVANAGVLVGTMLGASVSDPDTGALAGIAITALASGNGTWQYSTDGGSIWSAVGPVTPSTALLLRDTDKVRFVPDAQNGTTASFTFRAWDQTAGSAGGVADASSGGGSHAFSAATDTASISVGAVNDAPVLDASGAMTLTNVIENDSDPPGSSVAAILLSAGGDRVTDVDLGALEGLAVVGVDDTNGSWEYSMDGGVIWTPFGAVSTVTAVLLDANDRIRFVPVPAYGGPAGDITFHAWDQSSGASGDTNVDVSLRGGTTAFSLAGESATLDVIPVSDAPDLNPFGPSMVAITEDDTANGGQTVAAIVGGSITDLDPGALEGIAITGLASGNGSWEFSTDAGASWSSVGAVSDSAALLLRDVDSIRFVPDGENADTASFGYRAWDQTSGSAGTKTDAADNGGTTAFSTQTDTASILVTAVNDAPVLDASGAMTLADVAEDDVSSPGTSVGSILASAGGDRLTDVDTGALEGVAVIGVDDSNGTWEYSTDGGSVWQAFGAVSDASAVLLEATALVRFVPAPDYYGSAGDLEFRGWDRTTGSNGQTNADVSANGTTTAFSLASATATLDVTPANDAPVLTPSAPSLPTITEDDTANGGVLVSSLLGGAISDVDAGELQGIAITALASGNGTWEYSSDGGGSWNAVGLVSPASALLLRDSDLVRFVPDGLNGTTASFTYRAWDQTAGAAEDRLDVSAAGGTSAFSLATDTASITVTAVNDAPVLTPSAPPLPTITEDDTTNGGVLVSSLLGGAVSDVDTGALEGIAITGLTSGNGTWQYSTDAGSSWSAVGPVSTANALLLRDLDRVRFVPDGQNATAASLSYRAWDQSVGVTGTTADTTTAGGASAYSLATDTASITVTAVNDAPVLTPSAPTLPAITEDDTANAGVLVSSLLGGAVADVDTGALEGIAITGLASGTGTWQFSTDGGSSWSAVGPVSTANALLLRDTDRVRFVPDERNGTSASFSFRAWDQTSGSASSAFSAVSDRGSITVTPLNDAPVLSAATLAPVIADASNPPGASVAALFAGRFSDVDSGSFLAGVAVVGNAGQAGSEGTWQYSTDGGATWIAIGSVGDGATALVLGASARLRFLPAAGFAGAPDGLSVRALDDSYAGGFSSTAGGVEARAAVDTRVNGGTSAVAAGTSGIATLVGPAADVTLVDLDLEPVEPTPPTMPEEPILPGEVDTPVLSTTPEEGTPELVGTEPFVPILPVATTALTRDLSTGGSDGLRDETPLALELRPERRDQAQPAEWSAGAALKELLGIQFDFLGPGTEFADALDRLRRESRVDTLLDQAIAGSSVALTAGFSVGYAVWLTRGGLLLASLTSSMPAWRLIDPIPILASLAKNSEDDPEDDESLNSLVNTGRKPEEPPTPGPEESRVKERSAP